MSDDKIIIGLTTIVAFGIGAQWVGRRLGIPSVLILLPAGLLAGGVLGWVDPQEMFGELLFPAVTLLVSVLLFHSGLGLRVEELPARVRGTVVRLVSLGLLITLGGAAAAAALVLDVPIELAVMTGTILVVSGPTVIGPMLRVVRPEPPTGTVLMWEGTALDPIGATVGVVVLNLVLASNRGGIHPVWQMLGRLSVGIAVGAAMAVLLVLVISRFLVTDDMEAAVGLMFAVGAFGIAEVALSEAGLFATLTLGIALANQRLAPTSRMVGFGDTFEVLIIGGLFIVLGATIEIDALIDQIWPILAIVAMLVLVVRPVTAAICLIGTPLSRHERIFVGSMEPRGIVAAATAAQFSGTLADAGYDTDFLAPTVFGVILGTGVVYGLASEPVARLLRIQRAKPTRVALIGGDEWLSLLGQRIVEAGGKVLLVSTTSGIDGARLGDATDDDFEMISLREGAERIGAELETLSLGSALISSDPDAVVTLVEAQLIELLGRRHVLRVDADEVDALAGLLPSHWAVTPFDGHVTRRSIDDHLGAGATIDILDSPTRTDAILLAQVDPSGAVDFVVRGTGTPQPGVSYIGIVDA